MNPGNATWHAFVSGTLVSINFPACEYASKHATSYQQPRKHCSAVWGVPEQWLLDCRSTCLKRPAMLAGCNPEDLPCGDNDGCCAELTCIGPTTSLADGVKRNGTCRALLLTSSAVALCCLLDAVRAFTAMMQHMAAACVMPHVHGDACNAAARRRLPDHASGLHANASES